VVRVALYPQPIVTRVIPRGSVARQRPAPRARPRRRRIPLTLAEDPAGLDIESAAGLHLLRAGI
jgi:hypothetical protein